MPQKAAPFSQPPPPRTAPPAHLGELVLVLVEQLAQGGHVARVMAVHKGAELRAVLVACGGGDQSARVCVCRAEGFLGASTQRSMSEPQAAVSIM